MIRTLRNDEGTALVELALVLPLLLVLLLGMADFGKAINTWIDQTHLATEGVRLAAVNYVPASGWPTCPTGSVDTTGGLGCYIQSAADINEVKSGRTSDAFAPQQNGAKVCISFPSVGHTSPLVGDPVKVTVSVDYQWLRYLVAKLGPLTTGLSGSATMRLEAVPSNFTAGCYTPPAPS